MPAQKSFFQLFNENKEIIWAPCIYDCVSAKAAEDIGFKALTISSYEQKHSFVGFPSMTQDEMYISAAYMLRCSNLPILVDGEDGGGTPMEVYKNVKRFAEAGAMAISIEDEFNDSAIGLRVIGTKTSGRTYSLRDKTIPKEVWAANVQAAVEACKGTDCMVIARVNTVETLDRGPIKMRGKPGISFDEAIERAQLGVKMGAPMTMIQNICYPGGDAEWERIYREVPGLHCYPDIHADNGVSDIDDVSRLYDLGFQMITCHAFMKGAWKGMLEYGRHVFEDKNTIFTENDDIGYPIYQISPITNPEMAEMSDRWVNTILTLRGEN